MIGCPPRRRHSQIPKTFKHSKGITSMKTYLTKTWLVLILAGGAAYGQGLTGSISGNVSDPSGSPIPGADIALTNVGTTQARQARSDANGDFVFRSEEQRLNSSHANIS